MKNSRVFYLKKFQFLEVKFSIYLNRRVFVFLMLPKQLEKETLWLYRIEDYVVKKGIWCMARETQNYLCVKIYIVTFESRNVQRR